MESASDRLAEMIPDAGAHQDFPDDSEVQDENAQEQVELARDRDQVGRRARN